MKCGTSSSRKIKMMELSKPVKYILVSREDGSRHEFPFITHASMWLWHRGFYIGKMLRSGYRISHKETGVEYDVFVQEGDELKSMQMPCVKRSYRLGKRDHQPCAECSHFAYGCEWSERLEPVPGWNAIPTKLNNGCGKPTESYKIIFCPKYERG